jgi:peptidoglycan/LPS O-acetylase OafA/YrhL
MQEDEPAVTDRRPVFYFDSEMNKPIKAIGESHIPVLDGVRGMAISMVLLFHFWQDIGAYHFSPHVARMLSLASIGQKGVDLFFVLSGFLITGILLRTKGSPHYFKNFYIRRSLRIFPLYFAVVFGCLIAGYLFSLPQLQWHNTWWYLFYLQNFGSTFWGFSNRWLGHFWSLAVEEHYYLLWPLVVLLFRRRTLAIFSLSLIVGALLIRAIFLAAGLDVFSFTLCRMDTLALGSLLAILFTSVNHWQTVVRWTRRLVLPVAGVAFASFFILSGTGNPVLQAVKYTLFALLCSFFIVLALSRGRWNPAPRVFSFGWLRGMGKTSYAMYVFHPFIYWLVISRFYQSSWSPVRGMFLPALLLEFILAVGLTILVSEISWLAFEQPLLKLKNRFCYQAGHADN